MTRAVAVARAVAALAARQHGAAAHWQLLAIGLSASAIKRWVASGRLHRLHRAVYAVGHPVLTANGRWMAAVLACGPGAVLSHRDAAALHHLRQSSRRPIDVSASRNRGQHDGITVHHVRPIHPEDATELDGIPVSTVPRTLLDLAEVVPARQLRQAFEQAERLGLLDMGAIDALIARSRGRHGLRPLTAVVTAARPLPLTRSQLERDFLDLCREAGLPEPATNLWVAGHEVDCLWADRRLAVELDGRTYHESRAAMERDRVRDADLLVAGYRVLRVTYDRFHRARDEVARTLRTLYFRNPS